MKISKILSYVVLAVGILGALLWYLMGSSVSDLMSKYAITDAKDLVKDHGSEAFAEAIGTVSPMYSLTLAVFIVIIIATLFAVFSSLAKNPGGLKKTLIGIGVFALIVVVAFFMSTGVETPMKDGEVLSASGSKWVGAGLRVFYILAIVAVGLMLTSGIKKIIGK